MSYTDEQIEAAAAQLDERLDRIEQVLFGLRAGKKAPEAPQERKPRFRVEAVIETPEGLDDDDVAERLYALADEYGVEAESIDVRIL